MKKMYSLNEIGLLPVAGPFGLSSRKDACVYCLYKGISKLKLPIWVSPMPCIIDEKNFDTFENSLAKPILPRGNKETVKYLVSGKWAAVSLQEFKDIYLTDRQKDFFKTCCVKESIPTQHVCIDMANGHMEDLYETVKKAKEIYGSWLVLMVGNIAHPQMYVDFARLGVEYIRVGIGGGNACSTSVLTGIHASLPWLIEECRKAKKAFALNAEIVADGGIDTIDKAIKCLALGADFVMMGKQFAQCEEACGKTQEFNEYTYGSNYKFVSSGTLKRRKYYGNASKEGQQALIGRTDRPSEGISTWVEVNTTLDEYCKKFEDALRSCMSYTGHTSLISFIGNVEWKPMSIEEFKSYYKKDES